MADTSSADDFCLSYFRVCYFAVPVSCFTLQSPTTMLDVSSLTNEDICFNVHKVAA